MLLYPFLVLTITGMIPRPPTLKPRPSAAPAVFEDKTWVAIESVDTQGTTVVIQPPALDHTFLWHFASTSGLLTWSHVEMETVAAADVFRYKETSPGTVVIETLTGEDYMTVTYVFDSATSEIVFSLVGQPSPPSYTTPEFNEYVADQSGNIVAVYNAPPRTLYYPVQWTFQAFQSL